MKYGYARVSTMGQLYYGTSLEAQIKLLEEAGAKKIYKDAYTGAKRDRPQFETLLKELKEGDTLIVTKLDRFARSTLEGIKMIIEFFERGITVNILNLGIIENTPNGKLIFNVFMAFAEFERDMIIERTQEGKAIAKLNEDFKEGRPRKYSQKQIEHALELKKSYSFRQVEELTGISKSTLSRAKRELENK